MNRDNKAQQLQNNFSFQLEKSPKKKGTCPQCQKTGSFRYYEGISREYGTCERVNNCGYKKDPNKESKEIKKELLRELSILPVSVQLEKTTIEPDKKYLLGLQENKTSNFHKYACEKIGITKEHLVKWLVGSQNESTTFTLADSKRGLNVKFITYNQNGNRDKSKPPYYLKGDAKTKYAQCLYGLHLLSCDKIICLVESEKTAVIASFFYPQYDWLATGGNNGLSVAKVQPLLNRTVYYLSDADKVGKENSSVKQLQDRGVKHKIFDLFPERNDGYDLADAIRDGLRPEIKAEHQDAPVGTEVLNKPGLSKAESLEQWQYFEKDGRYFIQEKFRSTVKDIEVSNFTMQWLYRLNDGTKDPPYLFRFIKCSGESFELEIRATELLNQGTIAAIIMNHGCIFTGIPNTFKRIVGSLYRQSEKATFVATLGQHKEGDFFSFYNGVLSVDGQFQKCNSLGIVSIQDSHFYIPSGREESKNDSAYSDDRKFYLKDGGITLSDFTERIYNIYDVNGLIGLTYTISSIFRDLIFQETHFFPFLFLYGGKGSGKSTYLNLFMRFFGEPQPETTENSTDKAIERKFSQINNNIQYIKEFSSEFEKNITNILKNAYDGVGYSRAQMANNNRTQTSEVKSGLFIDGNYFPTKDDALFSRLIFLIWKPNHTEESKKAVQELSDLLQAGNGNLFREIYSNRTEVKNKFGSIYRETISELKNMSREKRIYFTEREVSHLALLAAIFKIVIKDKILNAGAYELFVLTLFEGSKTQQGIAKGIDDTNKFFEELETLSASGVIQEQKHYIREQTNSFDYLFINYSHCYNLFAEYLKKRNDNNIPTKQELKQKLEMSTSTEYAYANPTEKYFQKKFNGSNNRCFVFEVKPGTFELTKD